MDGVLPPLVDVDEIRAEIREQVRVQYRVYAAVLTVVSLVIGGLIGTFTVREKTQPGDRLTPPPYWGDMCVPAARVEGIVAVPTATPQPLRVYISGAVVQPGVVTLPAGSLLADALDAVGGADGDADLDGVNLAAALADNQHVIVPRRAATPQPAIEVAADTVPVTARVNISTASAAELEMLPHIGPAMAQRIIAYREAHGPFERIEHIQNVEGIGPARYKDLAPLITVE